MELPAKGPVFTYDLQRTPECRAILFWKGKPAGYRCPAGRGVFLQIGAMPFADFNSNEYLHAPASAVVFLRALLREFSLVRGLELSPNADHTVAFARKDPERKLLWITVKTGADHAQSLKLRVSPSLLQESIRGAGRIVVMDLLAGKSETLSRSRLAAAGLTAELAAQGSAVFALSAE